MVYDSINMVLNLICYFFFKYFSLLLYIFYNTSLLLPWLFSS